MKPVIIRILESAIILAALVAVVRPYYLSKISANTKCYANSGEICPDAAFLNDYDAMTALNRDLDEGKQSSAVKKLIVMSDQLAGLTYRLQTQIPKGYTFNSDKRKYVAQAPPAPEPTRTIEAPKAEAAVPPPVPSGDKKAAEVKK